MTGVHTVWQHEHNSQIEWALKSICGGSCLICQKQRAFIEHFSTSSFSSISVRLWGRLRKWMCQSTKNVTCTTNSHQCLLTHSCPELSQYDVRCLGRGSCGNYFDTHNAFTKYLKESCRVSTDCHFSFKYYPKDVCVMRYITDTTRHVLTATGVNGLSFHVIYKYIFLLLEKEWKWMWKLYHSTINKKQFINNAIFIKKYKSLYFL